MVEAPHTRLGEDLLAASLRECEVIRQALARRGDLGEPIHVARKAVRRLRALMALAGDEVEGLAPLDAQLSRLGDGLSALRDAHVAIATARRLAERHPSTPWLLLVGALERRRETGLTRELARDPGFNRRRRAIERIQTGLKGLAWRLRKRDLRAELEHSQRRSARARRRAHSRPTADNFHRWRRSARRLRMQLEATRAFAPALAREVADPALKKQLHALHRLVDSLGWFQDLRVLRGLLIRRRTLEQRATMLAQLNDALLDAFLEVSPDRKMAEWIRERGPIG